MKANASIADNTVSAIGQVTGPITYLGQSGYKVLVMGNSITRHEPKEEIGWSGDWGMAASSADLDYVHLLHDRFLKAGWPAQFFIMQASTWERGFWKPDVLTTFEQARQFEADAIVFRLGENVREEDCLRYPYAQKLRELLAFLAGDTHARVFLTTSFWKHDEADAAVRSIAAETGCPLVELGDLGECADMKAIGEYRHTGVAAHPGDRGMRAIAERIWSAMHEHMESVHRQA